MMMVIEKTKTMPTVMLIVIIKIKTITVTIRKMIPTMRNMQTVG
jgi:hypothetical protein